MSIRQIVGTCCSFLRGRICRLCVALVSLFAVPVANVWSDAVFVYEGAGFESDAQIIVREGKVVFGDVDETSLGFIYDTNVDLFRVLNHRQKSFTRLTGDCLLYTSPSPRDRTRSRMPSSA